MFRLTFLLCIVCNVAVAQDLPQLNPGETLIAIDGVPVDQIYNDRQPIRQHVANGVQRLASGVQRFVVNRDARAYQHALREAQILAQRGTAGHPLGCAPGTRFSGTGYSWSPQPKHCYYGEMPESRLVARACVRGANGAYFWSAHYR